MELVAIITLLVVFLIVRIAPIYRLRHRGCDSYNILLNAEVLRSTMRLPIKIPDLFILEKPEQWYPPGFLVFCALIPDRILKKYFWTLNHIIDFGSAVLIFYTATYLGAEIFSATVAVLLYASFSGLVNEFSTLNVRPFGLFLFNIVMLLSLYANQNIDFIFWAIFAGIVTFYSHKLSMQQLWFTLPVLSMVIGSWIFFTVLLGCYIGSFIIWPRGAYRVLRGHFVIIRFWHRNWRNLGAHQIKQSPVYSDGKTRNDYYAVAGLNAAMLFFKNAIHQNYFLFPIISVFAFQDMQIFSMANTLLLVWIISVYFWGFSIHFFKLLRGIGLGQQYIKFSLAPSLIFIATIPLESMDAIVLILTVLAIGLTLRQYILIFLNNYKTSKSILNSGSSDALSSAINTLADDKEARILCIPVHLCDQVAYQARKPVYWGTHSDVFDDRLETFFPVLKKELTHYLNEGVNRILIDMNYVMPEEFGLRDIDLTFKIAPYAIYKVAAKSNDL